MKTVFLDRDGVINQDSSGYIKSWDEFFFIPGSLEAIKCLTDYGFAVIIITNQSIINRKWISLEVLLDMHRKLNSRVEASGGKIADIFFCPHTPDEGCLCRKPRPGLIHQACEKYPVDIGASIMIGDSGKDILCGKNAGCGKTVLVLTGNGFSAQNELANDHVYPDAVVPDLLEAVRWIIS